MYLQQEDPRYIQTRGGLRNSRRGYIHPPTFSTERTTSSPTVYSGVRQSLAILYLSDHAYSHSCLLPLGLRATLARHMLPLYIPLRIIAYLVRENA